MKLIMKIVGNSVNADSRAVREGSSIYGKPIVSVRTPCSLVHRLLAASVPRWTPMDHGSLPPLCPPGRRHRFHQRPAGSRQRGVRHSGISAAGT